MPSTKQLVPKCSFRRALAALFFLVVVAVAAVLTIYRNFAKTLMLGGVRGSEDQVHIVTDEGHVLALPEALLQHGIYQNSSLANEFGVVPAYWEGREDEPLNPDRRNTHGPCYSYKHAIDWEEQIARYNETGEPWYNDERLIRKRPLDLEGYCRPGFVIIGAGKSGTSSLYHYISSHPKVLAASQKQIHYFKYHRHEPLKWYYQHFPSTASFLAAGALMSGEASPGYLPYPDVVIDMKRALPKPRLLAIGRNPIERSYSSYKYNYVVPTIKYLSKGKHNGIPKKQSDEFYTQFLYSFEDMMKAELAVLKECFVSGSKAEKETHQKWGKVSWISDENIRRKKNNLPSLIDLDGFCYGGPVNETVIRRQWTEMVAKEPGKVLLNRNTHLTQAFIGRSLYLFPLEWWYAAFSSDHIYFVCTEELQDFTGESMNGVGRFLGLPRYDNFSQVVQRGAYNVGGHRGYDNEIPWTQINSEQEKENIPLSEDFRRELEDFMRPYNERLFNLTGRRCDW